ncbi:MAG: DUF3108 domain-containing protein [Planctomycetota bacterium]
MASIPSLPVTNTPPTRTRRPRYSVLVTVFFILGAGHACRLGSWATVDSFSEWHEAPISTEVETSSGTAYFYEASWLGLSLGESVLGSREIGNDPDVFRFFFEARDIGIARLFSGRWTRLETTLGADLVPHRLIVRQERSEVLRERIFEYPKTEEGELRLLMRDGSIKAPPEGFDSFIDPLAAVHLLRRSEFQPGFRTQMRVAGGLRFFEMTFSCVGEEDLDWQDRVVPCALVQVDFTEINPDGTREPTETAGRVWIGQDEERALYRAEYDASIFTITIDLARVERIQPEETRFLY